MFRYFVCLRLLHGLNCTTTIHQCWTKMCNLLVWVHEFEECRQIERYSKWLQIWQWHRQQSLLVSLCRTLQQAKQYVIRNSSLGIAYQIQPPGCYKSTKQSLDKYFSLQTSILSILSNEHFVPYLMSMYWLNQPRRMENTALSMHATWFRGVTCFVCVWHRRLWPP